MRTGLMTTDLITGHTYATLLGGICMPCDQICGPEQPTVKVTRELPNISESHCLWQRESGIWRVAPPRVSVELFATSPSTLQYSTASMISLSPRLCRSRGGYSRRSSIWWLFQLNRFLGVHRPKQRVGKCDNSPHSTLFTALSSFLLEALVHQRIRPGETSVKITDLPFYDDQAMYTSLLDQL
jgi:hypothetical protein